jgi:hypothetical protein
MPADVSLDLLERVRIASPCTAPWEGMQGNDKVRFCGQCRLNVYNLSAMTRPEAEALVNGASGRLCARLYQRADGTVITQDCPVGLRAVRDRMARLGGRIAAALALLLTGGFLFGSGGRATAQARLRSLQPFATLREWLSPAPPAPTPIMGKMLMGDVCIAPPKATGK